MGFIAYEYDSKGNVARVTAKETRHSAALITDTKYLYDERNNLIKEYQAHGSQWDAPGVAVVQYGRAYLPAVASTPALIGTAGSDRLTSMTYPDQTALDVAGSNLVSFSYGTAGLADDASDRIASIALGTSHIASFSYTGSGRRASLRMGGSASSPMILQSFDTATGGGLEGLDRFGRVLDLHYTNTAVGGGGGGTLWRGEYDYDAAGNRRYERLTQRPPSTSVSGTNTRSRLFAYDRLDRLLGVRTGELDLLSTEPAVAPSDAYQTWHRKYDADVVKWIEDNKAATTGQFERYLKGLYRKAEMVERFPRGLRKGKR